MTRNLTPVLALCALAWIEGAALAQNGPDNDPDGLPGYTNNVFHQAAADSINLYNGQLTVPIALGPSYPVGPKLRAQLALTYNSRVWEYGHPGSPNPLFTYTPLTGDPSLGLGWTLTVGAIRTCPEPCFVGPDGARHIFDTPINATDYKTTDASPFYLRRLPGSAGYRMWDGDGNRYDFTWQVSGFDDDALHFTRDFGHGRNGWYVTTVADPFGNSYSVDYFDTAADGIAFPCWGYLDGRCASTGHMVCAPPGATKSWIVKRLRLPGGAAASVHLDAASRVSSIDFPVLVAGASTFATWTLSYDTAPAAWPCAEGTTSTVQVTRLTKISLPAGIAGSPSHVFAYGYTAGAILTHLELPTGGTLDYCYSPYTFFHGRIGALPPGCAQQTPPTDDADAIVQVTSCAVAAPDDGAPLAASRPVQSERPAPVDRRAARRLAPHGADVALRAGRLHRLHAVRLPLGRERIPVRRVRRLADPDDRGRAARRRRALDGEGDSLLERAEGPGVGGLQRRPDRRGPRGARVRPGPESRRGPDLDARLRSARGAGAAVLRVEGRPRHDPDLRVRHPVERDPQPAARRRDDVLRPPRLRAARAPAALTTPSPSRTSARTPGRATAATSTSRRTPAPSATTRGRRPPCGRPPAGPRGRRRARPCCRAWRAAGRRSRARRRGTSASRTTPRRDSSAAPSSTTPRGSRRSWSAASTTATATPAASSAAPCRACRRRPTAPTPGSRARSDGTATRSERSRRIRTASS